MQNLVFQKIQTQADALKKNTGKHLLNSGSLLFASWLFILLGISSIVFIFLIKNIWPFYIMDELSSIENTNILSTTKADINIFIILVKLIFVALGFALIYIGMLLQNIRNKNATIQNAGNNLIDIKELIYKENNIANNKEKEDSDLQLIEAKPLEFN